MCVANCNWFRAAAALNFFSGRWLRRFLPEASMFVHAVCWGMGKLSCRGYSAGFSGGLLCWYRSSVGY